MRGPPLDIDALWSKARPDSMGLVPCVVQDLKSRRVLMVAWVSKEALGRSLESGWATFWSRSRREIWEKGATSGHRQRLFSVRLDCDGDTLIYTVEPLGPSCHEGYDSCFTWRRVGNGWRRDPEPVDYPAPDELKHLAADLSGLFEVEVPPGTPEPSPPSKPMKSTRAIRIGAPIESKARSLSNLLQFKRKDRLAGAAAELVAEVSRALTSAGIPLSELRAALDAQSATAPAEPARPASQVLEDDADR